MCKLYYEYGGTVTFTGQGITFGSATVKNGTATLTFTLPTSGSYQVKPGNYSVSASYSGDAANSASTSSLTR